MNRRSAGALAAPPRLREWSIDPVTRVAGALAVHTVLDLETRTAVEAHSMAMLFRGYEIILKGRDPRDAIDISSRACGVCGGVHASVSSLAIEMAFGIQPPPLGVCVRNLGEVAEMFYDHPLHLGLLAGPDYSTAIVSVTNPELVSWPPRPWPRTPTSTGTSPSRTSWTPSTRWRAPSTWSRWSTPASPARCAR